ncbi:hypothetical protein BPOR_0068g00030 [Botrytis porri]|uniref:Uncharacterized protein n=1 Tax=Botrytis porri TaxID=87229 RepID=A0A4Z1L0X3_9HELO|nr:hypothetical protein BPOR_0068g00030 [Botrytis porri]
MALCSVEIVLYRNGHERGVFRVQRRDIEGKGTGCSAYTQTSNFYVPSFNLETWPIKAASKQ